MVREYSDDIVDYFGSRRSKYRSILKPGLESGRIIDSIQALIKQVEIDLKVYLERNPDEFTDQLVDVAVSFELVEFFKSLDHMSQSIALRPFSNN